MKYLLDTNACIAIIKQQPTTTLERLQQCQPGDVGISSVTLAELRYGASKSQASSKNHQALDLFLLPLVVAPFDEEAALAYGSIRAGLEMKGTPIGPLDTLIAAHAVALGVTMVTNNTREFRRLAGLPVEDWTI